MLSADQWRRYAARIEKWGTPTHVGPTAGDCEDVVALLEAARDAEKQFRWYGDLHAQKKAYDKANRNYEYADMLRALLPQTGEGEPEKPLPASVSEGERIYIASKTYQAPAWRALRDKAGWPIISTWIDEAGPGETKCHVDLWRRCIDEAKSATGLILYAEDGDLLKGALLEAGAALACNVPVAVVGPAEAMKTAKHHPGVTICNSLDQARQALSKREEG